MDCMHERGAMTLVQTTRSDALAADALLEPWFACLLGRLPGVRVFDCDTHLGSDPDGSRETAAELVEALDLVAGRAIVLPLAERDGYRAANDRVLAAAAEADGRLVAFCRIDPRLDGVSEAERAIGRGAAGIKLHPRGEQFGLADPAVQPILALADERRLPVIVHAGRGITSLGRDALELAARYPRAPLILAHAAITDLAWIWREAAAHPNLFFDTAWWNAADQLALFSLVPPGQILFASDTPYGRPVAAAAVVLRAALAAGLTAPQIAAVAGRQLERLLGGEEPFALGEAPMSRARAPGPLLERLHTLLVAAIARMTTGQQADEYLELARLACQLPDEHPDAAAAASVLELLDRHARYLRSDPAQHGPRPPGIHLIFVAAAVARIPHAPLPAMAGSTHERSAERRAPGREQAAAGGVSDERELTLTMDLQDGYRFLVDFEQEDVADLLIDEPEPLGEGSGPNAARVLAAAVGNCLSASALYCLHRARIEVHGMHTTVSGSLERNDAGRLRVKGFRVLIEPVVEESQQPRMGRCLELFEDFCVVTQSVRAGIEVDVAVEAVKNPPAQ